MKKTTPGVVSHVKSRTPEFQGGHPKSNGMPNLPDPTAGVTVGSQAARKPEYAGGHPKSKHPRGNGNVVNGRPRD